MAMEIVACGIGLIFDAGLIEVVAADGTSVCADGP